jgi:hypothetical protein
MAEAKQIISTVVKAFRVEDWLASGDLLEFKSIREVAAGAGVSENEAYRILKTMVACGRADHLRFVQPRHPGPGPGPPPGSL